MAQAELIAPPNRIIGVPISKEEMDRRLQKAERDITKLALNYHFEVADLLDGELVHIRTATTNEETTGSTLKSIFTTANYSVWHKQNS